MSSFEKKFDDAPMRHITGKINCFFWKYQNISKDQSDPVWKFNRWEDVWIWWVLLVANCPAYRFYPLGTKECVILGKSRSISFSARYWPKTLKARYWARNKKFDLPLLPLNPQLETEQKRFFPRLEFKRNPNLSPKTGREEISHPQMRFSSSPHLSVFGGEWNFH